MTNVRAITGLTVLALAGSAAAAPARPATRPAKSCRTPQNARLVASNRRVLLWEVTRGQGASATQSVVGCERSVGRRWVIADFQGATYSNFRAAGRYVMMTADAQIISSQTAGDIVTLFVYDVHRRHEVFQEDVAGTSGPQDCGPMPTCASSTTTLNQALLNARGFGAWMTTDDSRNETITVHDHRGTRVVGRRLHGVSGLALTGDTLTWRVPGQRRTVRLR